MRTLHHVDVESAMDKDKRYKLLTVKKGPLNVRKHAPMNDHVKFVMQRYTSILAYKLPANLCMRRLKKEMINEIDEMEMA